MFRFEQKVLFKHCDPAGIVFYPRYFEMVNDCVEAFFAAELDCPFERLHQHGAVPTAAIEADFKAPSRHGDHLQFALVVTAIGRSSCAYAVDVGAADGHRFGVRATLVNIDADGRATPWPKATRTKLSNHLEAQP